MKEICLPPLIDEPKILGDYDYTWTVDNWRSLNKKEHGPVFQAGGFPWSVWIDPIAAAHSFADRAITLQANFALPPRQQH